MEADSIPQPTCDSCGAPLSQDDWANVCTKCSHDHQVPQNPAITIEEVQAPYSPNPDNPPWGAGLALGTWGFSIAVSLIIPLIALLIWLVLKLIVQGTSLEEGEVRALLSSPTGILIQVISTIPVHLLTLIFCWAVVSRMGRYPFWAGLGWNWTISPAIMKASPLLSRAIIIIVMIAATVAAISLIRGNIPHVRLATGLVVGIASVAVAALFILLGRLEADAGGAPAIAIAKGSFIISTLICVIALSVLLERILPQKNDTPFDLLIRSSPQARIWLAGLAVLSAPFVEEFVYRGVLYSALRARIGVSWAVSIVSLMFVGVHVPQYLGAWGGLVGLAALSFILTTTRAATKSIFPCVVIHALNNVLGAIQILNPH